ncbi:MAG: NADH-quinone oxidoreductase subunit C [Candidatus Aminicenantes bacterium]|nr:NADH-quinone oxidoreductase subunit C [Acidobacteriota bacterium]MBU4404859.1 NADH-quinone oxidoreductase subunit C [Acidobacteriota bacterium]MCG2812402.1 NADH-quinone oxidoreductase subunit C [Candidatus Aminicenantes bacterium]
MNAETIVEKVNSDIREKIQEISLTAPRRVQLKVAREQLNAILTYLKEQFGFTHLGTISGVDLGENFEVVYHMSNDIATVNVRILTPRSEAKIPSVCAVIPGAILYERELQDMFGLVVENIPDPRPLLLADDWPAGQYPLRKDWQYERPAEVIPGGE